MEDFFKSYQHHIRQKLEAYQCPTHGQHPKITFTNSKINVSCCCEEFRTKMIPICDKLMGEVLAQDIDKRIKKALR